MSVVEVEVQASSAHTVAQQWPLNSSYSWSLHLSPDPEEKKLSVDQSLESTEIALVTSYLCAALVSACWEISLSEGGEN